MATRFWHPFADMGAVSENELLIERGEGVHVFDADGNRYLDATASLWYANVGHPRTGGYLATHGFNTSLGGIEANVSSWGPLVAQVSTVPNDSLEALEAEIHC